MLVNIMCQRTFEIHAVVTNYELFTEFCISTKGVSMHEVWNCINVLELLLIIIYIFMHI